jgi:hypothetical protein
MQRAIPFWSDDPSILLNKAALSELWPSPKMTFEQKLNAISRLVIALTVLGFIFTMSTKVLLVGVVTVVIIFIMYKTRKQKVTSKLLKQTSLVKEGFSSPVVSGGHLTNPVTLEVYKKTDFVPSTKTNPFGNVLLTDIGDNPDRKSAAPAFNPEIYEDITSSTKKMVQRLNPSINNTNKQLFGDLGEEFYLDQSNRNFYATANTRVANDQGAFADFLYGTMPSSKDSNALGAIQRVKDSYRYTLY